MAGSGPDRPATDAAPSGGTKGEKPTSWPRRMAWFVALWLGGVAIVATVAYAIRAVIL